MAGHLNKKSMIKVGVITLLFFIFTLGIFFAFFSSAQDYQKDYFVGETLKLDLDNSNVRIVTPSRDYVEKADGLFFLYLGEEGDYRVEVKNNKGTSVYDFHVFEKENQPIGDNFSSDEEEGLFSEDDETEGFNIEPFIELGKPVKNSILVKTNSSNKEILLPKNYENLSVIGSSNYSLKKPFYDFLGVFDGGETLVVEDLEEEVEVVYYTPGPEKSERIISDIKKEVVVYSETPYENVLASTTLDREISSDENLKVYWKEEGKYLDFNLNDLDGNGLYENVEWVVPHLSTQTFEIIIEISFAEHLDSQRNFIEDIYESVYVLDDIWSSEISDNEYVRVKFEENLTNQNDITIYPEVIFGNPKIEVYEINGVEKIAEFSEIKSGEYNKVYLTGLLGEQDTFDLKVVGGSLEFDHIIDPYSHNNDYAESIGQSTTTSTSYQDKTTLTFTPEPNSTYLILASWLVQESSASYSVYSKLTRTTGVVKDFNELIYMPKDTTDYISGGAIGIDTFGSSPGSQTYKIQYRSSSSSGTARIKEAKIFAIRLSDEDYYNESEGRDTTTSTSFVDKNPLTFTPDSAGDYIIIASATGDGSGTNRDFSIQLEIDGTGYSTSNLEPVNAANRYMWATIKRVSLDSSSHTIKIKYFAESPSTAGIADARVVALRADDFRNNYYAETEARATTTSTTYQNRVTLTQTPQASDYLVIASSGIDGVDTGSSAYTQLVKSGTTYGEMLTETKDTSNRGYPYFTIKKESLSEVSTRWDLQYRAESSYYSAGIQDARISVLDLARQRNSLPTHTTPILNSSLGMNVTSENLTIYNQSTYDSDGDNVKNIFNWYLNSSSFEVLNLPFEGGSNFTWTKDYSGLENDGTVSGAVWNESYGYDGRGV
ncbi:MAG: hypothetical protein WC494_02835 [Candidatus Pacearchaeota archaeon]